jgi:hypothetical protein
MTAVVRGPHSMARADKQCSCLPVLLLRTIHRSAHHSPTDGAANVTATAGLVADLVAAGQLGVLGGESSH